jgi:hypothetical protein
VRFLSHVAALECFCNCSTVQTLGEVTISLSGPLIGAVLTAVPLHTRGLMYFVCSEILKCDFTNGTGKVVPAFNAVKAHWSLYVPLVLTLKLCMLPTECTCVFRMVLTINSDCFPKRH